jgi:Tfp pilus assembly protein PilO
MLPKKMLLPIREKAAVPIWIVMGILVILSVFVFLWQLKTNSAIRKNFTKKDQELKDAQKAGRRLAELEKQSQDLKDKEKVLVERVPSAEKDPLASIKIITQLGSKKGLIKMSFKIKTASALAGQSPYNLGAGLSALYFVMECQATYPQLLDFLKELMNLKRVVAVEKIEVRRDEKALPYQRISINLVAFTFAKQ